MLKASNSNEVAGKTAKEKVIPGFKLKDVGGSAPPAAKKAPAPSNKGSAPAPLKPSAMFASIAPKKIAKPAKRPKPKQTQMVSPAMPTEKIKSVMAAAQAAAAAITPAETEPVAKPQSKFDLLHVMTLTVAVVLATIAAYFSVSGMTRIFPGAEIPVIIMASTMEAGKLAGAAWLSRNWLVMGIGLRLVLCTLVVILACINAVGVFGQLSAAHLNPHVAAVTINEMEAANQVAKIDAQQRLLADLNRRIAQIDSAIEEATKRGRSTSAMELAKDQRRNRAELVEQRGKEEQTLIELRTAQARITAEQQKAAADVGVLEYAATLFGIDREQMIQLLILAMVLSCDPLSITLVIATAGRKQTKVAIPDRARPREQNVPALQDLRSAPSA
jgi:hypothetical protein